MGVCNSENDVIRQRRLTKKNMYKYSENQILNNTAHEKNSKKFDKFKINEINCDNFYNINNNFNYSVIENPPNNNKNINDQSIDGLNLMNQPIENLTKGINNNDTMNNEQYQKLLTYCNTSIEQFPYKRLSPYQITSYENEYISSKFKTPYKFIEQKNYSSCFNKIYELCFLKCEPLLNNINDDKKSVNLLFLKVVIILLNENYLDQIVKEVSNLLIELAFKDKNYILDKEVVYHKIKSFSEICYQIIFYFIIAYNQFTEQQYQEYLNNPNILIQDKYSNIDIDIFCLNTLFDNTKGEYKLDEITSQLSEFVCGKIDTFEQFKGHIFKNEDKFMSYISKKIIWIINPYHLLQLLAGLKLPTK